MHPHVFEDRSPKKGENTRKKLICAAIELIAKQGFDVTSFQMIADKCGLQQPSLFYHFENREALVEAVIKEVIQHSHVVVSKFSKPTQGAYLRLKDHFEGTLAWAYQCRNEAQILGLLYYYASFQKRFSLLYQSIRGVACERILEILLAGQREGVFSQKMRAKESAEILHDALLGGIVNAITTDWEGKTQRKIRRKWEVLIRTQTGSHQG